MRRFATAALLLAAAPAWASFFTSEKDSHTNMRYQESAAEKASREFREAETELPPLPDTQSGEWFDVYVGEGYTKKPKILLSSLAIMPAPDNSVRYVLNTQSANGHDNLTAEGIFCARSSFKYKEDKLSSYKVFGYGDPVNRRWIQPRNPAWKPIGDAMSRNDALRAVLYQTFCVDGRPNTVEGLQQRLRERAARYSPKLHRSDK